MQLFGGLRQLRQLRRNKVEEPTGAARWSDGAEIITVDCLHLTSVLWGPKLMENWDIEKVTGATLTLQSAPSARPFAHSSRSGPAGAVAPSITRSNAGSVSAQHPPAHECWGGRSGSAAGAASSRSAGCPPWWDAAARYVIVSVADVIVAHICRFCVFCALFPPRGSQ